MVFFEDSYVPEIDSDLPLPKSAAEAMPTLSPGEELQMRARTIKLLSDLNGTPLIPSEEDRDVATDLAKRMIEDPKYRPEYANYPNETMAYLAGMVAQSNCMIVDDLAELKQYVTTKLLWEIEHTKNGKDRLAALKLLGEVDGVDAFKRRTEITHAMKPIEEVEKELKAALENIEYHVVGAKGTNGGENDQNSPKNGEKLPEIAQNGFDEAEVA